MQRRLHSRRKVHLRRDFTKNWELYVFILPALIYIVLYCYIPMYGAQIAFKDFTIAKGIWGSKWVGFKHFERFLSSPSYRNLIWNTLNLSLRLLLFGFPCPILFALLINELRTQSRYRKVVQTVSYAPHFISVVALVAMLNLFLCEKNGMFNNVLRMMGGTGYNFLGRGEWFPSIYVISGIWQDLGWNAIIYLSALAGVDPELHEAAMIDGANRFQRIVHINLPCILPTIVIMLILQCGNLMSVGFEKVFLMQTPLNLEWSEIISTFVYKMGLLYTQYSFSTAVGLFNSVVNFILLMSVNLLSRRLSEYSLW